MNKIDGKAQSQRQLRVSEQIRHALAWVFERGEMRDPELNGIVITITEVRISPDLRNATVYIFLRNNSDSTQIRKALSVLSKASPFLRKRVADTVYLRKIPKLNFCVDNSFDNAIYVNNLLSKPLVARDLKKVNDQDSVDEL